MTKLLLKWRPHVLPEDQRQQPPVKQEPHPIIQTNGATSQVNSTAAKTESGTDQTQQHNNTDSEAPPNTHIAPGQTQEGAMDATQAAAPESSVPAS